MTKLSTRAAAVVAILSTGAVFTTCRESEAPPAVQPSAPEFSIGSTILFQDNFETGTAAGWNATAGTWSVVLDGSNHVYRNSNTSGDNWSYNGSAAWTDYAIEALIKPLTWNSGGIARIFGRWQDANDWYYVNLTADNHIQLRKSVNGTFTDLAPQKSFTVSKGTWYKVRLEMVGTTLKAYVNDVLQLTATDATFSSGLIALGGFNNTAEFDNVVVYDLTGPAPVTLVGAGNIGRCDRTGDEATAALLDNIAGTVFTAGDNAFDKGTLTQYQQCYNPNWGRQQTRTRPAPGDWDYKTANASGYFGYFGAAAGDPAKGYYSYDLGTWHVIVLNSGSTSISTAAGSPQEQWLRADLAAHPARCTVAYWHHPLFDSKDPPNANIRPLWNALYAAGVDVVVNAHYAFYERFAPQTSAEVKDAAFGIREFVVGTGGATDPQNPDHVRLNSEVRNSGTFGVLKLTLNDGGYAWEFVPIAGQTFRDSGTDSCHGAPPLSVNAGPDLTASPGTPVSLSVSFTDPGGSGNAPWSYAIAWGDGATSTGTTPSSPIAASHFYSAEGQDSVRVTVTNNAGGTGSDSLAVLVSSSVVMVGAGDIADCTRSGDSLTANLMDTIPGTVFALGDNAYPNGSSSDYANCYAPTWGRHKARTRPIPGNHDYVSHDSSGYFGYFGAAAGDPAKGYYSYDLGAWHIIALNSQIAHWTGSPQEQWLRADLAASTKRCTLAYWHYPLFSSSTVEVDTASRALWRALYDAGVELVLNGHHHDYERFAPQTPTGTLDPTYGIREIIVGTGGGEGLFPFGTIAPNSEVRDNVTFGVLKLTLRTGGFDWKFIPIPGKTFTDAGSGTCHDSPSAPPPVNHAPTAAPGGPYSGAEAGTVSFNGSGSSDPDGDALTYAWSFGDGTSGTGVNPSHVYADNGSYTVTLTVTDTHGAASTPATTTATVANVAPTVTGGPNQSAPIGSPVTVSATFSDPGTNDAPWAYAVAWGDGLPATTGSTTSQTNPITATHTYALPGTYTVSVTVTDKDGGAGSGQLTVTVGTAPNRPPTAAVGGPYSGAEGAAVSFDGSGSSDPDGDALTYAWNFGDGNTGTSVRPSHTYADNGSYTVTLTVTDSHGTSSSPSSTTATIANVAPAVTPGPNQSATIGIPVTVSATFSDPGTNDAPWTYTVAWGDGLPATTGSTTSQTNPITATHTYALPGTYTVSVTVTDKDGGAGSGQLTVTVGTAPNRPPSAAAGGPYSGAEGAAVSFDGSGSSDPDGDALTYAWNFGDGSTGTGVRPSHAYADNRSYTVTLTVTDSHGASSSPSSTTATIANVAPSVNPGPNQTATTGSPVTLSASFSDPGANDTPWAYSVDWGDGSAATTGSTTSQSSPITATHTYTAAGTSTVRITVTDKDGAAGVGTKSITVSAGSATVTLVGAGNIARCDRTGDEATAAILDTIPGSVFADGDGAYPGGTPTAYGTCYDPSWGRHKARTLPVPGHRDYDSSSTASGYFSYWGAQAGDPTKGYYSFDLGAWHVVVLNSNNTYVSTAAGSPQETWLRSDLAATTKQCVLALFHNPRFYSTTSSTFSPTSSVKPFWDDLYAAHAELIVNGHMRDYERFAPQTPTGAADPVNGIREIIVGTGGEGQDLPNTLIIPNSEVNLSNVFGVLKLTLGDGTYAWQFIPVAGQTATDSGSGSCH